MARVAGTAALLRSVASSSSRVARALPPLHRKQGLSSAPPPPLNELGWRSITRAAINASLFLAFGAIMFGWVKPKVPEEFRECFAAASRERSEMKEEIIRSIWDECQKIRDLLEAREP